MGGACVASLLIWPIHGSDWLSTAIILGSGAAVGFAAALAVSITPLAAAAWADDRLHLKDLLATAATANPSADPAWTDAVRQMADRRCADFRAPSLGMKLIRTRANAVIVCALALAITVNSFPNQKKSIAQAANESAVSDQIASTPPPEAVAAPSATDRPASANPLDEPSERTGESASALPSPGSGSGLARTPSQDSEPEPIQGIPPPTDPGTVAGGGIGTSTHGLPGDPAGLAGTPHPSLTAAPLRSLTGPLSPSPPDQPIRNDQIDPTYQDLVRDYFQRP
jgi:hypothetical protein